MPVIASAKDRLSSVEYAFSLQCSFHSGIALFPLFYLTTCLMAPRLRETRCPAEVIAPRGDRLDREVWVSCRHGSDHAVDRCSISRSNSAQCQPIPDRNAEIHCAGT